MPLYVYACPVCSVSVELLRVIADRNATVSCATCEVPCSRVIVTPFAALRHVPAPVVRYSAGPGPAVVNLDGARFAHLDNVTIRGGEVGLTHGPGTHIESKGLKIHDFSRIGLHNRGGTFIGPDTIID